MGLKEQIVEQIKADFQKKVEKAENEANVNSAKRFSQKAPDVIKSAMNEFYLAYNPDQYVRTYGLYNGVITSFSSISKGDSVTIRVSSENIPKHLHDDGDYIYEGAFRRGIHGRSDICVSTPPKSFIQDDLQDLMDDIQTEELQKAVNKYLRG